MKNYIIVKHDDRYKVIKTNKDYKFGYESRELALAAKAEAEKAAAYMLTIARTDSILNKSVPNPAGLNLTEERKKNNERVTKNYRLKKDK